ncbi:MAG TPA: hypothetical protein VGL60_06690 [Acidimicrobiales bacterium]|jgi:hypothetical protein
MKRIISIAIALVVSAIGWRFRGRLRAAASRARSPHVSVSSVTGTVADGAGSIVDKVKDAAGTAIDAAEGALGTAGQGAKAAIHETTGAAKATARSARRRAAS